MSKPIVQLKELFQYIAGSQWTSHHRSAIPHVKAASSPAPTYSVPSRHKARCISACLFLSALVAPLSRGALWLTLACQAACVECRLASQCSHHGGIHSLYLWRSRLTVSLLVNSRVSLFKSNYYINHTRDAVYRGKNSPQLMSTVPSLEKFTPRSIQERCHFNYHGVNERRSLISAAQIQQSNFS